jgi:WD40 repeat protein
VFGLKGDVKNNIHYLDDVHVLYPAGYSIVMYNTEKKTQKFISLGSPDFVSSCDISALAFLAPSAPQYSHSSLSVAAAAAAASGGASASALSTHSSLSQHKGARLLAVAERGEPQKAVITVFELASLKKKNKYILQTPDVMSREFVSVAFSADGRYLLAQGGAPDWTLVNFLWERGRLLQMARVSNQTGAAIHQVSFCPVDSSVVCVTGNGILRFLHIENNEFKAIPISMAVGGAGTGAGGAASGSSGAAVRPEARNYTCHCWVEERVLVGTDTGDILLYENAEFLGALESSPSDGKSIDCVTPFSRGFVAGSDEGVLYVFECDDREYYRLTKSFQIDNNYVRIKSIAIAPGEDKLACTLENNQSFMLSLGLGLASPSSAPPVPGVSSAIGGAGSAPGATGGALDLFKSEDVHFEQLTAPCHFQAVLGMDVCARKPLLLTCGLDRSVRVWNYFTRTLQVLQFFSEQPLSVAFHPSGLQLVVGFADCVRLFALLLDELRCIKELPVKACRELRFANGGHYLAVANGSAIHLYATFTCELLGTFTTHRGRVRSILWAIDDSTITSAGADGQVLQFKVTPSAVAGLGAAAGADDAALPTPSSIAAANAAGASAAAAAAAATAKDFPLVQSYSLSRGQFTSAIAVPETRQSSRLYAASSDRHLRVVQDSDVVIDQHHNVTLTQLTVTQPLMLAQPPAGAAGKQQSGAGGFSASSSLLTSSGKHQILFAGTDVGVLRCFSLPLTDHCYDIQCHSAPVTRVALAPYDRFLFTASEDGTICVFELLHTPGSSAAGDSIAALEAAGITGGAGAAGSGALTVGGVSSSLASGPGGGLAWATEVLVSRADLVEKSHKISELQTRVERAAADNDSEIAHKEELYREKRREIEIRFQAELELGARRLKELEEDKAKAESWFAFKLEQLAQHHQEKLNAQESMYTAKVQAEEARCAEVQRRLDAEHALAESEVKEFDERSRRELAEREAEYAARLATEREERAKLVAATQETATQYAQLKQLVEADADEEIDELRTAFEDKFLKERAATLKLRDSNAFHQNKFKVLRASVSTSLTQLQAMKAHHEQLYADIADLSKDIQVSVRELRERDAAVQDKVRRLAQLKKKAQELEKFKFVLDCKLAELKRQLEPRRKEMEALKAQVVLMHRELAQYDQTSQALELHVRRLTMKHHGLEEEVARLSQQRAVINQRLRAFKSAIREWLGAPVAAAQQLAASMAAAAGAASGANPGALVSVGGGDSASAAAAAAAAAGAALGAVAAVSGQSAELSAVTRQMKHGLRAVYQQHVLGVLDSELLREQRDAIAAGVKLGPDGHPVVSALVPASAKGGKSSTTMLHSAFGSTNKTWATLTTHGFGRSGPRHGVSRTVRDVHGEYQRQRQYLERSIDALVAKGKKALTAHAEDNARVMQENVALTKEINQLRRELQVTRAQHRMKTAMQQQQLQQQQALLQHSRTSSAPGAAVSKPSQTVQSEIEKQHEQIRALKNQLMVLDAQLTHDNRD